MHKVERPIEVQRVIFSEVSTLHEGPPHNTRSVSWVTKNSHTESTDSEQPNESALDHLTPTLGVTSRFIPCRSERLSQPPERYCPGMFFTDAGELTSYEEASASADSAAWNRRALLCKGVYPLKETFDSTNTKYKARLVAKVFRQEYGINFNKIFSPMVKMTTLRFMFGVMASENLELIQLDVKMAFLHGDLKEEIYMEQPKGFVASDQEHLVCQLRKSLYTASNRHHDSGTRSSRQLHPVGRLLQER